MQGKLNRKISEAFEYWMIAEELYQELLGSGLLSLANTIACQESKLREALISEMESLRLKRSILALKTDLNRNTNDAETYNSIESRALSVQIEWCNKLLALVDGNRMDVPQATSRLTQAAVGIKLCYQYARDAAIETS